MSIEQFFFYFLAAVAVVGSLVMVTRRQPLSAALSLVVVFVAFSGLYAMLSAPLLAILQILVYAGAIMALVIFVIMFLNVQKEHLPEEKDLVQRVSLGMLAIVPFFYFLSFGIQDLPYNEFSVVPDSFGHIEQVGRALFSAQFFLAFEIVSILLTVALVGVVVLAKRRI